MVQRHYSSNARETALTASVSNSDVTLQVDNPVGYPSSTPFVVHCELGTSGEEIMLVTAVAGNTWTVTRGYDGSTALPHDTGAKLVHGVSAVDFEDAASHIAATTGVHGVTGALVGTTASQTLSNKTLTSPTLNSPTINSPSFGGSLSLSNPTITGGGSWAGSPTITTPHIASFVNATHTHTDDASGGVIEAGFGNLPRVAFGAQSQSSDDWFRWSSPIFNIGSMWSASNNAIITAPIDGLYLFSMSGAVSGGSGTSVITATRFNSSGIEEDFYENQYTTSWAPKRSFVSGMFVMNATDYIRFIAASTSGSINAEPYSLSVICLMAL